MAEQAPEHHAAQVELADAVAAITWGVLRALDVRPTPSEPHLGAPLGITVGGILEVPAPELGRQILGEERSPG